MQAELPSAVYSNLISVLQKCRERRDLWHAKKLHAYLSHHQLELHPVLGNYLVPLFVDCGSLLHAQLVFDRLPQRSEFSWTSLIHGYVYSGEPQHALHLYYKMQEEDPAKPNMYTYVTILGACARLEDAESGQGIHAEATKRGLEMELYVGSTLVDMYTKCGQLAEAQHVFDWLPMRNAIAWAALLAGYAERGLDEDVSNCFLQMQREGICIDAVTFVCSLKACGSLGALARGQEIHAEIMKRGLEGELHVGSTLVDMYAKCGLLVEAHQVFNQLQVHNVVSWNTLIAGYADHEAGGQVTNFVQEMQLAGISPDSVTFVCSLKTCKSAECLETGQELHAEISKRGLEKETYVCNTLVDMYVKYGLLAEAQHVFDQLPVRTLVSWNALIAGYTEHGCNEEVLNCVQQLQVQGMSADAVTYICSLKACGAMGSLESGLETHAEIMRKGLETELRVGSMLVDMYGKCGLLVEAQAVFDTLTSQDALSWNALITAYAECGSGEEVLTCFKQMQSKGVSVDAGMFVCSLRASGTNGDLEAGQELHFEIIIRALETDVHVGSTLVDFYIKCGFLVEACRVFDQMGDRDVVSWNALIAGYTELGSSNEVENCFQQMQMEGISPDSATYVCSLKACGAVGALERGQALHAEITKKGMEREIFVGNALVDMYTKCGFFIDARHVFKHLPGHEDIISWNALIAGDSEHGLDRDALDRFQQIQLKGMLADSATFACSLKACGSAGVLQTGLHLHGEVTKRGLERELFVGSTLVDMYAQCGSLAEANQVFEKLSVRNAVSWNALIAGLIEHGLSEEALNSFKQMQLACVPANVVTFVLCLKACGTVGALETGREIHAQIRKSGLEKDIIVSNILIDMYGKCGSVAEGWEVFQKLPVRDVISWTAMITAYGENHEGNMAVQCFEDMLVQGVKPDSITFTCLLAACSHANLLLKGQEYFKMMSEKYDIEPTIDHYGCMVDLLARAGLVYEAEKFISALQCPPSTVMLLDLLSACKIYGELEVGHRCFQQLVELNKEDASAYSLMADMYGSFAKWCDANKLEDMRNYADKKKKPGSAIIEVDKKLQEFVVTIKPSQEILETLGLLNLQMKPEGHVPILDLV